MKMQSLQVTCFFSDEEDVQQILLQSFRLYISRILAEHYGGKVSCP